MRGMVGVVLHRTSFHGRYLAHPTDSLHSVVHSVVRRGNHRFRPASRFSLATAASTPAWLEWSGDGPL